MQLPVFTVVIFGLRILSGILGKLGLSLTTVRMNAEDFPSDSESSDEDYVPTGVEEASDAELSELEDNFEGENEDGQKKQKGSKKKKGPKASVSFPSKRQGGIRLEEGEEEDAKAIDDSVQDDYSQKLEEQIVAEKVEKKIEEEKKKADSLWDDFMKDVGGPKSKPKPTGSSLGTFGIVKKPLATKAATATANQTPGAAVSTPFGAQATKNKVTITKEYDFAGETIKVTKEVDANSKEALMELKKDETKTDPESAAEAKTGLAGWKRPATGGLGGVLGKIGKKPKLGTLEKSKMDWNAFKQNENISEELEIHNRGKDGYLERMAFLERTDVRQYEKERSLRMGSSSKR